MALINSVFFIHNWVIFDNGLLDLLVGLYIHKTGKSPRSTYDTFKHQCNDLHNCELGLQFLVFYKSVGIVVPLFFQSPWFPKAQKSLLYGILVCSNSRIYNNCNRVSPIAKAWWTLLRIRQVDEKVYDYLFVSGHVYDSCRRICSEPFDSEKLSFYTDKQQASLYALCNFVSICHSFYYGRI